MPAINPKRLLDDLYALRGIGTYKTGVHRPTFSADDVRARQWLTERMTEAGLDAQIDGIGNVLGFSRAPGRKILAGSHIESQNYAGWLDGPLGVIYALEAARALGEDPATGDAGVDVVAFCDEEGHFGVFLGSRSFVGEVTEADIDNAARPHPRHADARRAGGGGLCRPATAEDRSRPLRRLPRGAHRAGPRPRNREQQDRRGHRAGRAVELPHHRGGRAEPRRHHHDVGAARCRSRLVRLVAAIDQRFADLKAARTVWTFGSMRFEPGEPSIIPGRAHAILQFRDADLAVLQRLEAALFELADQASRAGPCAVTVTSTRRTVPAAMDARLAQAIEDAAAHHAPGRAVRMPSSAGHDAQIIAQAIPAAMMFVPSIGGISHHWSENTSDEDIVLGARVFTDAIASVLRS